MKTNDRLQTPDLYFDIWINFNANAVIDTGPTPSLKLIQDTSSGTNLILDAAETGLLSNANGIPCEE